MLRSNLIFAFCCLLCFYERTIAGWLLSFPYDDPDVNTNVSGLIANKGYPVEEHTVQTADGYLLSVLRIPRGRNGYLKGRWSKGVVLLIHGIVADASCFVLNFPSQSLGFILPDEGYDVWLLNTRGCTYSKKHVRYTTRQYEFWNFSFDQVAQYDAPATIDYILDTTGQKNLYVIGHSQGTTSVFAMLSEMPDYNDKVRLFIALAPIAFIGYTTTAGRVAVPFAEKLAAIINAITSGEFLPKSNIGKIFCGVILPEVCEEAVFLLGGEDRMQWNETRNTVYFAHYPSGTSTKSALHYAQLIRSKKFRKFDYGLRNIIQYGQMEPPDYVLSDIRTPVALFSSTNDKLADPEDVNILRGRLKTIVFDYVVPYPSAHLDFVLGINAHELIYGYVLQLLAMY